MLSSFRRLREFARAKRGMAAVEFAILLPLIVLVFFGLFELSNGMACRERVESLASTTSDLVAQSKQVSDTDLANIFSSANAIVYPFPAVAKVTLSSLSYVDDTHGLVQWSAASTGAMTQTVGTTLQVPQGAIASGGTVILSEVSYTYTSPTKFLLKTIVPMSGKFYSRPRRSVSVVRVS